MKFRPYRTPYLLYDNFYEKRAGNETAGTGIDNEVP